MKLYISDLSIYVLLIFYLPLVFWCLYRIWNSTLTRVEKYRTLLLTIVVAYVIPLGDVTRNSLAMAELCPTAGLHIYKTVNVDGYLDYLGDGDLLKQYPYRFIEVKTRSKQYGVPNWNHYERQADNTISVEIIDAPTAAYEIKQENNIETEFSVQASRDVIINRKSGEVLAEWKFFTHLPGWLDRVLVYRWFGSGGREGCEVKGYDFYGFRLAVLQPKLKIKN